VAYLFLRSPSAEGIQQPSAETQSGEEPTAEPAPTTAETAEDAGPPDAADERVPVTFVCVPKCDKIVVDGDEVKKHDEAVELLPGKHTVVASKAGYVSRNETITVELGTPLEKKLVLVAAPKAPTKKPCGKFLKRCD
jgi:hypothetical protein